MIFTGSLFLLWLGVWTLLSWPPDPKKLISGVIISVFVTFMTRDVTGSSERPATARLDPFGVFIRIGWFSVYVFLFLWECFKANVDVAYRVLHPDLPIRPGTVRLKTTLKSDIGLTFLANSITLTPGTTTVDVDKERGFVYVHMLNVKQGAGKVTVVDKFEKILKRIFE